MEKEFVDYIIKFLLGEENKELFSVISYGTMEGQVIIKKSCFFDESVYLTPLSKPQLPLANLEGTPILFGENSITYENEKAIINADIIASTFFLITRYEEYLYKDNKDEHGRYTGRGSLLYKIGCLERPIVEEYGDILKHVLERLGFNVVRRTEGVTNIFLTHDVDQIWQWNDWRSAIKTMLKRMIYREKNIFESIKSRCDYKKNDVVYTFPWLVEQDKRLKHHSNIVKSIYFFMGCMPSEQDFGYIRREEDVADLINYLQKEEAEIGIHVSYQAGKKISLISEEIKKIEHLKKGLITSSRYHYLASRDPLDYEYLIENGVTDDFTMGYADVVGFRLGTCRAVQWINPIEKRVTNIKLHPLTAMECTLEFKDYMGLNENQAYQKVCELIEIIFQHQGEISLLWHNTSVKEKDKSYQRRLYENIITYIEKKITETEKKR